MKPLYLLDTNVISELMKPDPNPHIISKIDELKERCAISSTTWGELLFGLGIMPQGKKRSYHYSFVLNDIQTAFPVIDYDSHAAWIQADLRSRLQDMGEPKAFQDTQIASIAIANQMILVTRNYRDFEPMQECSEVLYLENWFE